ncbi:MAG: hypothetical protein ABUR63_09965 [Verrucomicrobiota bacterium]
MRGFLTLLMLSGGLALASAACDASRLDDSSGSGGAAGGHNGTGGSGRGGAGGTAGSPGSVTFVLATPPGESFCDQLSCGSVTTHLSITGPDGQVLNQSTGRCGTTDCTTCEQLACPTIAILCPAPEGVVYTGGTTTWDGAYQATSTCGMGHTTCSQPRFAAPGRYVAQFCATPGDVTQPDGGFFPTCAATGPVQCTNVAFDFPSATPVQLTLPAAGPVLVH